MPIIFFLYVSFHNFERLLKALRIKFSCWSFVFTMKSQQGKSDNWKLKKMVLLLVLFRDKYFPKLILCIAFNFLHMFFVNWTVLGIVYNILLVIWLIFNVLSLDTPIGAVLKNSRHINFKKYAGKISMAESFSVIIHPKVRWALWKRLQVKFLEQLLLKTMKNDS